MSLVDHLDELRRRLFRVILAVALCGAIGFVFADDAIKILIDLLPRQQAQTLGPGDAFAITLRVSLVIGVILAMPVILYQGWAFIAPGLTPSERKAIRPWVPLALFFFWFYYPTAIEYEDRKLRRIFGEKWEQWAARTPALVPRFGASTGGPGTWSLATSAKRNGELYLVLFSLVCLAWVAWLAWRTA